MVVQNISGKEIRIPELNGFIPADKSYYLLPYPIAYKYKKYLKPVQLKDDIPINSTLRKAGIKRIEPLPRPNVARKQVRPSFDKVSNVNPILADVKPSPTINPEVKEEDLLKKVDPVLAAQLQAELKEETKIVPDVKKETKPEEKPKKKRGRPKGAKNKKKKEDNTENK